MVGAAAADGEFDGTKAFGATSFVSSTFFVNVNPDVNAAAVKFYADELSLFLYLRRRRFYGHRRRGRITNGIEHAPIIPLHG